MEIEEAALKVQIFENGDLTDRLFNLEVNFQGINKTVGQIIPESEVRELEGILRHLYRFDSRSNKLAV